MTYDVGNTSPGLGQAQKWGMVKPVNGIPILDHNGNTVVNKR